MTEDLHYLTIDEAARRIAASQLSPVELTAHHLRRIEALDGTLHSFLHVTADLAMAQAQRPEAEIRDGRRRGPLHGIPFGLKDVYDTAAFPTTGNSQVFRDRVPARDA